MKPTTWICFHILFTMLHSIYTPNAVNKGTPIQIVDVLSADIDGNKKDAISTSPFSALNYNYTGVDVAMSYNVDKVMNIVELPRKLGTNVDIVVTSHHFENNALRASYALEMLKVNGLMVVVIPADIATFWQITDETANWWARETNDRFFRLANANSRGRGTLTLPNQSVHVLYSSSVPGGDIVMIFLKCDSDTIESHGARLKQFLGQVSLLSLMNLYRYQVASGIPVPAAFMQAYKESGIASATIPPALLLPDHLLANINPTYLTMAICRYPHPKALPEAYLEVDNVKVPVEMIVRNPQGNCTVNLELILRERDFYSETDCDETIREITSQLYLSDGVQLYGDISTFVRSYVEANRANINFYRSMSMGNDGEAEVVQQKPLHITL